MEFKNEDLISLKDAAKEFPRRSSGKHVHIATLYRWASRGYMDVVLETVQVGGMRCTTKDAITQFIVRVNEKLDDLGGTDAVYSDFD